MALVVASAGHGEPCPAGRTRLLMGHDSRGRGRARPVTPRWAQAEPTLAMGWDTHRITGLMVIRYLSESPAWYVR
jgi:hypothetical protein